MNEEALKDLEKEVRRLKRQAGEWASRLHDLVEDGLPAAYEEIPATARSTYEACRAWADAQGRLVAAQNGG
jgi:hypothetical protein